MYRLHAFAQSGNCFKVAFLLRALNQPFDTVFVDYMGGVTREASWRDQTNAMGEIPVLEDGAHHRPVFGDQLVQLVIDDVHLGG